MPQTSATKAIFRKRLSALVPVDDEGRDLVGRLPSDRDFLVEVKTVRSSRQHRLFFALLNLLVENTDAFVSVDVALKHVKIATGEVDELIDAATGQVFYTLRSIAFASMDGTRFTTLFDRALHVITERWLVGTSYDELRDRVFDLVDGPAAAALGRRVA